ncbi:hypothetical protein GNI_059660 [Gregarina niphandrodes]|uniref:EF-hand domain-containing protein n=1 Tax=Gregarina niphandrodes TaxID=110365 RepID=A0A023B8M6_GRENI|nr:hypothetical protein GNI_059660 [Gregarina niphandrodes]EZG69134.1 hypothetical protein GNI_059660 [Gregarina niphandrodes]|eukprot:XP_011134483.1 hypothetical protein GNI_059660 [Gregarina niphandrodes]
MVETVHLSSILVAFDYDQDGVISVGDLNTLFGMLGIDATGDDCEMLLQTLLDFTKWQGDVSGRSGLSGLSVDGLERVMRASAHTEIDLRSNQWVLHFLKGGEEEASAATIGRIANTLSIPLSEKDCVDTMRMWGALVSHFKYSRDKFRTFGYVPQPPLELIHNLPLQEPTIDDKELLLILKNIMP